MVQISIMFPIIMRKVYDKLINEYVDFKESVSPLGIYNQMIPKREKINLILIVCRVTFSAFGLFNRGFPVNGSTVDPKHVFFCYFRGGGVRGLCFQECLKLLERQLFCMKLLFLRVIV